MAKRTVKLRRLPLVEDKLGFFRFGDVAGRKLLTNDAGQWIFLSEEELEDLLAGRIGPEHSKHEELCEKGFLREGLDIHELASRVRRKKSFMAQGPHLHIVITTLRCNQTCKYCHASRTTMDRVDTDMSLETAKKVVDHAMQSSSDFINFEYQGGEPTLNMPVLKLMVEYSREKNRHENKRLMHSVVTNMTTMTDEIADWLIDNEVLVCTSLDGPEQLHNANRSWKANHNAYATVREWIDTFNRRYVEKGRDPQMWHVDALMTTSRATFDFAEEVVDLYVDMGLKTIHLRPLNPFGFAVDTWKRIGYTPSEYLDFYAKTLDYIIELNKQGTEIVEGTAATFLTKMLTPDDPNFVDIRSPCGAAIGQVAYNYDGKLFTCDEARMVSAMGNNMFEIGEVGATSFPQMIAHPTVRALAVASLQDALPGCETCFNVPFCGVCPVHNYMEGGDLFGQRPTSPKCQEYMTIATLLFERLADDSDGQIEKIFRRWTLTRPRELGSGCVQ